MADTCMLDKLRIHLIHVGSIFRQETLCSTKCFIVTERLTNTNPLYTKKKTCKKISVN